MKTSKWGRRRVTVAEGLSMLPGPDGERFVSVFQHGNLDVELYAPRGHDPQTPHTRDEVYVVVSGTGWFVNGETRERFGPGDFLFVPAGVEHRFEAFSDDFVVWVLFYGPEGGERPATSSGKEIERKFLVADPPDGLEEAPRYPITQGYLVLGDEEARIRCRDGACVLSVKRGAGLEREEAEVPITRAQYEALWPLTAGRRVEKTRHLLSEGGRTIELDVYHGSLDGLLTAEVEFDSREDSEAFDPPPWFGADVTEDRRYKNRHLAVDGRPASAQD